MTVNNSCPFDYVKVYDGYTGDSAVIGTFCGNYTPSTVLYSTAEALFLEFVTGQGRIDFDKPPLEQEADFSFDRRGFNISYEFSERFVDLGQSLFAMCLHVFVFMFMACWRYCVCCF